MRWLYLPIILCCALSSSSAAPPKPIDAYKDISAYIDNRTTELSAPNGTRDDLVRLFGVPDACLNGTIPAVDKNDYVATIDGIEVRRIRLDTCGGQIPLDGLLGIPAGIGLHPLAVAIYGTAGSPERVFGLDGIDDYNHSFALQLAKRGYLTFVPTITTEPIDADNINDLRNKLHRQLLSQGSTLAGVELGQMVSAINYLEPLSNGQVIIWGISLGGFLSAHLGALDGRIDVTVISQYFEDRRGKLLGELDYPAVYWQFENADYIHIPGYAVYFDDVQLSSLIAPRSIVIEVGTHDVRWPYVQQIYPAIEALPGCSALVSEQGGHEIFFAATIVAVEGCF